MRQESQATFSTKKLVKFIAKTVKENVASKGIHLTTRKGNKELELLVRSLCKKKSFTNLEEAREVGERLGEKIVQISQQRNKKDLDRGVIRFLASEGEILTVIGFSTEETVVSSQPTDNTDANGELATINTPELTEETVVSSQPTDNTDADGEVATIDTPELTEEQEKH